MPAVNAATGQVLSTRPAVDHGHRPESYDTYIAGHILRIWRYSTTKRHAVVLQRETDHARSLTIHNHGRPRIVCMTARFDVTPKTTEHNRIVRTGKSEAKVTNNKKSALEVLYY